MPTTDKDFKVKNGLNVATTGTFGGVVTVATPTQNTHATTKLYVDTAVAGATASAVATESYPGSPSRKRWILDVARINPCSIVAKALSIPPGKYARKSETQRN